MDGKNIYFLSGLPRSGSTLLGSILAQNPDIYVTPTSPLYSLLVNTNEHFNLLAVQYTFDHAAVSDRVYRAMIKAFYADVQKKIIFDKHRGWPKHVDAISTYLNPNPRIVCTMRPIAEIITSYLVLADKDPDNFIDKHLKSINSEITNESRAALLWEHYLKAPYEHMQHALQHNRENVLLVEYRDIVFSTEKTLKRIYDFCGIDAVPHDLKHIENRCAEAKDEAWGLKDLHTIRPELSVKSRNPEGYLPIPAITYFAEMDARLYG